jgi:predicted nucleic acid-binding protein
VAGIYVDTSALGRVLLREPDAPLVLRALADFEQRVASRLLGVELRRLALRTDRLADADQLLAGVALIPLDDDVLALAETIGPSSVATLDAIHLVTAVRAARMAGVDSVMTYDRRLADGAREHGLAVIAPA